MTNEDRERLRRYREYLDFYNGKQWRASPRPTERCITLNYARTFVHKCASYLFGAPYGLSVPPVAASPAATERAAEAERLLKSTYEHNGLWATDYDTAVDCAVLGDGAYKVTWDALAEQPAVVAVDPQTLEVSRAPDDYRRMATVRQTYPLPVEEAARRWGVRVPGGGGEVAITEEWTAAALTILVDDRPVSTVPNVLGEPPYVVFPNVRKPHSPWGESDLVDIMEPARELNSRMSMLAHILEVSGNPIAVLENVDAGDGIRVAPGELWELPERSRAYLLDMLSGGGVRLHIEYIDLLYRCLHDLAETPRTAFGDSGRVISGAALEVEMEPLVQKVSRKCAIWTGVIQQRNELMLRLIERSRGLDLSPYRTLVHWPSLLPEDRSQLVRDEVALVGAGVHSRRRAMDALGEDAPEEEWARVLEEGEIYHGDRRERRDGDDTEGGDV
ncbi:MAG: phage portal protein [Chloroflexota bacterium]|nr:phage portal protein [Chloroflexota bacterium]